MWPATLDHTSTATTHHEAARALLDASGAASAMDAAYELTIAAQLRINPQLVPFEKVLRAFLLKYGSFSAIRDDLAKLYAERFTELQLRQMVAFYETSTGKAMAREVPTLVQAGGAIGREKIEQHQAELVEMIRTQSGL